MASVKDIPTIPGELFAKFQTGFYAVPVPRLAHPTTFWPTSHFGHGR
jgi:predicted ATP-dependent Lon-type protease